MKQTIKEEQAPSAESKKGNNNEESASTSNSINGEPIIR